MLHMGRTGIFGLPNYTNIISMYVNYHSAACALQFLRSKGIAHMDLKPQNLLLSITGNRYVLKVGGTYNIIRTFIIYMCVQCTCTYI